MAKVFERAEIVRQEEIAPSIYSMLLKTKVAALAIPGQFISVYSNDEAHLLPRPISICEIFPEKEQLRIVYRIAGEGTKEFSRYRSGDSLKILGPLGNGYNLLNRDALIIGGGIGIPPMLGLAKEIHGPKTMVLGYRSSDTFLLDSFKGLGDIYIASDDGSVGIKGTVIDAIENAALKPEVIYACGPMPMLKAVKAYAGERDILCYLSLEERMACGIGACLGCITKSTSIDNHSKVRNKRICTEGPVFDAREVAL